MNVFWDDYYHFTGKRKDSVLNFLKNIIFRHNLRFLYWLRKAEKGSRLGKIQIGDDVLIAPGAYINFDVPPHSVVLGNPGIIHRKANATKDYIGNIV